MKYLADPVANRLLRYIDENIAEWASVIDLRYRKTMETLPDPRLYALSALSGLRRALIEGEEQAAKREDFRIITMVKKETHKPSALKTQAYSAGKHEQEKK